MNQNANAIFTLCSHLCVGEGVAPLEPKEWSDFAQLLRQHDLQPQDLFAFSPQALEQKLGLSAPQAERICRLLDRSASLSFEMSQYENMGIFVLTRADENYPQQLKKKLGSLCPPLFYAAGDLALLTAPYIGFVGSRSVGDGDTAFTEATVRKTFGNGFGVVSGGAKGVDTIASDTVLSLGGKCVQYLSDSMVRKLKSAAAVKALQHGMLLLLSVAKPDAAFNVGIAMMRNRYIYAQSAATVIVRSEYQKGGTWAGASENIRHGWCTTLCREKKAYRGNTALIAQGAVPVTECWDGSLSSLTLPEQQAAEQLTLFD